jgi:hypothetical protein
MLEKNQDIKKLKIGFLKLGLKTYFLKNPGNQGSNHELVSVFKMFQERGHKCFMISNSDLYPSIPYTDILDYIFVFNGFAPKTLEHTNMNMMKQPIEMIKIINAFHGTFVYFWTDPRYNPDNLPITNKNRIVLSQEPAYYSHLDKIILYGKKNRKKRLKYREFKVIMNNTKGERWNNALKVIKENNGEIIGDHKDKKTNSAIGFNNLQSYLDSVKYSWNQTKDSTWTSQKFWEMILSNVICFHYNSDTERLIIPNWLRIDDIKLIPSSIESLKDKEVYKGILRNQKKLILPEYLNGDFIYKIILKKLI